MTNAGANGRSRRVPVLEGVLPLSRAQVSRDVLAGFTLAALAIPEVMGYTRIAGMPVITGLYTILVPMTLFAIFGSSRHLVVGADSATAAIMASALGGMALTASPRYVALAGLLALMTAVILIVARLIRLGFLADFLSRTVLIGFLTGVGVQVACSQIPGMLGISNRSDGIVRQLVATFGQLPRTDVPTLAVSVAVLVVIVGAKRISRTIPAALLAVVGSIVVSYGFDLHSHGVAVLGAVPRGLPAVAWPAIDVNVSLARTLFPTALSMFVVILAQSAATSRAYAARYGERFREDVDLVGLSLANVGAGLTGAFVVNGSPTKTQMVDSAGGMSQLAMLTTSAVTLVVLLFMTGPLAFMPEAVLSTVVFLIGIELIDVKGMRKIHSARPAEFWVALLTAVIVVVVGVEEGIVAAMVLSLLGHVWNGYRPRNSVWIEQDGHFHTVMVSRAEHILPGLVIYRFNHSMYYANAELLSTEVVNLVTSGPEPVRRLCIDMAAVDEVDFTAGETLLSLVGQLEALGTRLVFSAVSDDVRQSLERSGVAGAVGTDAFYETGRDVVEAWRKEQGGNS